MAGPLHVISLGAGVQSSTMALMAAHGEITPMPSCAIFADTQDEPIGVYGWLDWLERHLPFPVHRVTKGRLSDEVVRIVKSRKSGLRYMKGMIPAFVQNLDGSIGLLGRKCTETYKIGPIVARLRELALPRRGEKDILVSQWIGISTDEAQRMKPNRVSWIQNRFPLIDANFTRMHCLEWMRANGYPAPPRSACVYCPFHSPDEWLRLKTDDPEEFERAVQFERRMQNAKKRQQALSGTPFLHRSCKPLADVRFETLVDTTLDMFGNECEGMCGV